MSLSALYILYFLHSLGLSISSFPFQAARIFWQTPCFLPPKYCIHYIFFLFVAQILLFDTAFGINRLIRGWGWVGISLKCISVTFPVDFVSKQIISELDRHWETRLTEMKKDGSPICIFLSHVTQIFCFLIWMQQKRKILPRSMDHIVENTCNTTGSRWIQTTGYFFPSSCKRITIINK